MVREQLPHHPSQWAAISAIAPRSGRTKETQRRWLLKAEQDAGERSGPTRGDADRLTALDRRNVSFVQPNFGAIAEMAAHWDGWCGNCSRTKRTARSRTSGLNRCARDFAMTPSSHKVEPPVIPGRFRWRLPLAEARRRRVVRLGVLAMQQRLLCVPDP